MRRMINRTLHLCGCVTAFDLDGWRSVLVRPCYFHERASS